LLVARARGGPKAMTARDALRLGTRGGAAGVRPGDNRQFGPRKRPDLGGWGTGTAGRRGAPHPGRGPRLAGAPPVRRTHVSGAGGGRGGRARRGRRPRRRGRDRARTAPPSGKIRGVSVSLSTHVLDVERGRPAAGVQIELWQDELVASGETNDDGRIPELATDLEPGTYRLFFRPGSPFFRSVALEISLVDGHYHVPLLVSSYSCTTYRGS